MGFEASHGTKMQAKGSQCSSFKALDIERIVSSRHKRSKSSDPDERLREDDLDLSTEASFHLKLDMDGEPDLKKKSVPDIEAQSFLKQEILQLEKRLQHQFAVRRTVEKALGYGSSMIVSSSETLMPKPTMDLIREIAVLELEVMHLEHYLLSLYRKAFVQQISTVSPSTTGKHPKSPSSSQSGLLREVSGVDTPSKRGNLADQSTQTPLSRKLAISSANDASVAGRPKKLTGPGVHCSHSALSQRSVCSGRKSPKAENLARALRECHSQPLSFPEHGPNDTSEVISLADYLGTHIADHVPETPNKLSEDLLKCMCSIFCKLGEPPLPYPGLSSSPISSFSSISVSSPQYVGDTWSPGYRKDFFLDAQLENPFRVEGLKVFSGPYNLMVEIPSFCINNQRLGVVEDMLQNYKSLAHRLESIDPRKMKNEEKLAFWINLHNALVMHAYLSHGVPLNNLKRASLLPKAMCNIGGHVINADTIQNYILGCRTHHPGQWLRTLLSPRLMFKAGNEWQAYSIEHPEPRLHFALCSGSHSDPAVRVYTAKRVNQELETAKQEYIRAAVSIRREQKILMPKIMESFARDSHLSLAAVVEEVQRYLPETIRMAMQRCQRGRSQSCIVWVPHNFTFRYLLSRELACSQMN